jgi:hypothetical protein
MYIFNMYKLNEKSQTHSLTTITTTTTTRKIDLQK